MDASHRPWPLPDRPWVMHQTWHDLLFAHWPLPAEQVLATLPVGLQLDTFDGHAWVGVVPFRMSGVRLRGMPHWTAWRIGAFPELNVRTYVRGPDGERPGVWFYSLDAASPLAVAAARRFFHLPYFTSRLQTRRDGAWVDYRGRRSHSGAPASSILARYGPVGPESRSVPGSLEYFLTERYCLYAADRADQLYRGEINHLPWPLQPAMGWLRFDTLVSQHGLTLPEHEPVLHFARQIDVRIWPLARA